MGFQIRPLILTDFKIVKIPVFKETKIHIHNICKSSMFGAWLIGKHLIRPFTIHENLTSTSYFIL